MRTHKADPRLDGSYIVALLESADEYLKSATRRMARASMSLAMMRQETDIERARRLGK